MKNFIAYVAVLVTCIAAFGAFPNGEQKRALNETHDGLTAQEILSTSRGSDDYCEAKTMAKPTTQQQLSSLFPTSFSNKVPAFGTNEGSSLAPIQRAASVGENFYGYLAYSKSAAANNWTTLGVTKVAIDGTKEHMFRDQLYTWQRCGFYHNGLLWLFRGVNPNGNYTGAYFTTLKLDGSWGSYRDISVTDRNAAGAIQSYLGYFITMAFDPDTETAYGYSMAGTDGSQTVFATWSMSDMNKVNAVRDVTGKGEMCSAMTFHDGKIYGITVGGKFVEIAKDGTQTVIYTPNIPSWLPTYVAAMAWSPSHKAFLYNALTGDADNHDSKFYLLDPASKSVTLQANLSDGEEYYVFFSEKDVVDAKAPAEFTFEYSTKQTPDLKGDFSVSIPTIYADSTEIASSKKLTLVTYLDNVKAATAEYAPGATATVPYELAQGTHLVRFELTLDGQTSIVRDKIYVGYDIPNAPASCTLNASGQISWKKVTGGVNSALNAYFDIEDVVYDIYLDGELVAADQKATAATTTIKVDIPSDHAAVHQASAIAKYHGNVSTPRVSTVVLVGSVFSVPFQLDPLSYYTTLFKFAYGTNGAKKNWTWYSSMGAYRYYYDTNNPADAWLFLPAFEITDTDKIYEFAMNAWVPTAGYAERFEVYAGKEATIAGMTQKVIDSTDVNTLDSYKDWTGSFIAEEAGKYFIGIHCISDKDQNVLYANNFRLTATEATVSSPAPVENIVCTPAAKGELKATIEFTLPTKSGIGKELTATTLTATVASAVDTVSVSGAPGATLKADVVTVQGMNTITVTASAGTSIGQSATAEVYTGIDLPGRPTVTLAPTANDMGVKVSWTTPTEGENGGYIDPADLSYEIYQLNSSNQWSLIGNAGKVNSTQLTANSLTDLSILTLGVRAVNSIGKANYIGYDRVILGPAMNMPVEENFAGAQPIFSKFIVKSSASDASLYIDSPSKVDAKYKSEDDKAIFSISTESEGWTSFNLPKVSTVGVNFPAVVLDVYEEADMPEIEVIARTYSGETTLGTIKSPKGEAGWTREVFEFPASLKNLQWVEVLVKFNFNKVGQVGLIDTYLLRNHVANDFAVSAIDAPSVPQIGSPVKFVATVNNKGFEANVLPGGQWTLTQDNKVIMEKEVKSESSEKVAPESANTFEWEINPEVAHLGKATVKFELTSTDGDSSNNSMSADIEIVKGTAVVVTDLKAEKSGNDVKLTWSEPEVDNVEGFENDTPFVVNPAKVGVFKTYDGDGKQIYGFNDWSAPCPYDASAFTVWNSDEIAKINANFNSSSNSGKQYIIARCPQDGSAANDWLISPAIDGVDEITFYARAITYQYGAEVLEVLTSNTTDAIDQFKLVETVKVTGASGTATTWQKFSVKLPEGAKYFAIRYVSVDIFGVMLDDISYSTSADVKGYHIVRDKEKIDKKNDGQPGHVDTTVLAGKRYVYNVIPILADDSEGVMSNDATVDTPSGVDEIGENKAILAENGVIRFVGFNGEEVAVYGASGICMNRSIANSDNYEVAVAPGVYMVVANNLNLKIMVK